MINTGRLRLPLTLAAIALLYLASFPRLITFEDAGLFHQVCHLNGIAHPPGYPLFTAICAPLYSLGFDPVITGNLISITFAIATLALLYLVMCELGISALASAIAIFAFGSSLDFWSQAIIVEVYSLNTMLISGLLLLTLRYLRKPIAWHIIGLALVGGLALANHWPLVAASATGFLILLASRWQQLFNNLRHPAVLLASVLALMLGLSPYLAMYLKPQDVFGYSGSIENLTDLVRYISRDSYSAVDQSEFSSSVDKLKFVGWFFLRLAEQSNWLLGLISIYGLYLGLTMARWINTGIVAIFLGNSVVIAILLGFDFTYPFQTAFSHYPLVAYLCWFIWFGYGVDGGINRLRQATSRTVYGTTALLVTALLAMLFTNYSANNRQLDKLAQRYANLLQSSLPENAVVIADADAPTAILGFMQQVAGVRKDITFYEADNAFSQQRLPGSEGEKRRFLLELSNERPVYGIEIAWLPRTTDHGFFQEIGESKKVGYAPEPAYLEFINEIGMNYRLDNYHYRFNHGFVHQSLLAAGQYLVGRLQSGSATNEEVQTLIHIQQTFPGALGAVSATLFNEAPVNQGVLIGLLRPFEGQFPAAAMPAEIAQFYFLMAALHPGQPIANLYLQKSYAAMPLPHNPVCQIEVPFETEC